MVVWSVAVVMVLAFKGSGEAWSIWCWGGGVYIAMWWGGNIDTLKKVARRQFEEGSAPLVGSTPINANKEERIQENAPMICGSKVAPEIEP